MYYFCGMITLETLIGDLLLQHNCVVIPNFGGFIAQRIAAEIDTKNGMIIPPRKAVLFNRQLINNDGLLAAALSRSNNIGFEEALLQVKQQVNLWNKTLNNGERIQIDKVGIIYLDAEKNLRFEQDRFYNLLLASFGLSSVRFISTEDAVAAETKIKESVITKEIISVDFAKVTQEEKIITQEEVPIVSISPIKKGGFWKYAAVACLLPIGFYSFWIPLKTDVLESGMIQVSDFNPFAKHTTLTYKAPKKWYAFEEKKITSQLKNVPENIQHFSYEVNENKYVAVKMTDGEIPVNTIEKIEKQEEVIKIIPVLTSKQLIVGSYSTEENAKEQVDKLAVLGVKSSIIQTEGKFRVSAGWNNAISETQEKLTVAGISFWVFKG